MPGPEDHEWGDLDARALVDVARAEFENFAFDVIKVELFGRHSDPPHPNGPVDGPDGGRDFLLEVDKPPRISKASYQSERCVGPLTEDPIPGLAPTRTVYSCKSGDDWLNLALKDARKGAARAVEVLREGGYFKLFINVPGKLDAKVKRRDKKTPKQHLVRAYWDRLRKVDPKAADPGPRIEIVDAHAIASFLRATKPSGLDRWVKRLDLSPLLRSLEAWRRFHVEERQEPPFEEDASRAETRERVIQVLRTTDANMDNRVVCIAGPPGVGKTRLVLELLTRDPALAQRVRVALTPEEAGDALDASRLLRRYPAALLVVDDCLPDEAEAIATRFRASARETEAHLLVLVPASVHAVKNSRIPNLWLVEPLVDASVRNVVARELGRPPDDVDVVQMADLSGGFPWFARLLAEEARQEAGRAPRDMGEALQWALASQREAGDKRLLHALRRSRARSLLAASLTRAVDWGRMDEDRKGQIAKAVCLASWEEVLDGARECHTRGILRRRLDWHFKYVTPGILEREIIAWLLGPDGSDPGGRTLSRFGQPYMADFVLTLERLSLPATVLDEMARVGLETLSQRSFGWAELREAGILGSQLLFIARRHPGATARELRRRVDAATLEELRAGVRDRRALVFALEEVARRREGFDDAEVALFRLAQAENESFGNNATGCWADHFLVELGTSYITLERRMALLAQRLSAPEASARLTALAGVGAVLNLGGFRLEQQPADGPWLQPTPEDARSARVRAWTLLGERFDDEDLRVAARAKALACDELRGAVRRGYADVAMGVIASRASALSDAERVRLRARLEEVRTYDADRLDPTGEYPDRLERVLAPTSFRERLRQQIGAWGPARLRGDDESKDGALAREGLAGNANALLEELDWLVTDDAQRSHVFAGVLGRCDERGLLLAPLRDCVTSRGTERKARLVFARYLGEWSRTWKRHADVDAVLRAMHESPQQASTLVLSIVEVDPTHQRIEWLESTLRAHLDALDEATLMELARHHGWLQAVPDTAAASLLSVLVEGGRIEHAAAALELVVDGSERWESMVDVRLRVLLLALERLAVEPLHGMSAHYWERGANELIERGYVARVSELAVVAVTQLAGSDNYAWVTLHRAAERDALAVWGAIAAVLNLSDERAGRLVLAFRFHRAAFAWPADDVLRWVGSDERRGLSAVSLIRPYGSDLHPILRALLQRFGAHSSVAREIAAEIRSTDGVTASLASHDAKQLEHARRWLTDADPEIATFAAHLVESLERSHEQHMAYEEDQRRRYGT